MARMLNTLEPKILLISADPSRCSAVRRALEQSDPACRVAAVASFAAARLTIADLAPDVIVLEEASLRISSSLPGARTSPLADVVSALAGFAPVVILGADKPSDSLAGLIAAGAADFVPSDDSQLPDAAACVEKRVQARRQLVQDYLKSGPGSATRPPSPEESFAEILRHELNNPLTGILGNAELLLAEMRREKPVANSDSAIKRLETIAALAVRMRETVRRLSLACEAPEDSQRSDSCAVPRKS